MRYYLNLENIKNKNQKYTNLFLFFPGYLLSLKFDKHLKATNLDFLFFW